MGFVARGKKDGSCDIFLRNDEADDYIAWVLAINGDIVIRYVGVITIGMNEKLLEFIKEIRW